jgi:hypothetical protein
MMSSDYVMLLLSHDLLSDFIDLADGIIWQGDMSR